MDAILKMALTSWDTMHSMLPSLTEPQVKAMLDYELETRKRHTLVERLHQRYNTLRVKREREELMALIK